MAVARNARTGCLAGRWPRLALSSSQYTRPEAARRGRQTSANSEVDAVGSSADGAVRVNYYEKHIGDYIRDTVSLTMLEDGAYNRLIDQLYQTERALPKDKKEVYRLARAISQVERKAVDYVLDKFFTVTDEGHMQKRAQAVIEAYWDREPAAESKRENTRIRQQRTRDRRKSLFDQLRELGVTPEFNAPMRYLEAELSRVTVENSHSGHKSVTRDDTLTQTPDTNPQSPDLKTLHDDASVPDREDSLTAAPLPPREAPPTSNDPAIQLSVALRKQGVVVTFTHPAVQDWATKGVTVEMLTEAVAAARLSKGENAKIPPNYLVPIVNDLLNPQAAATPGTNGKARNDDWGWKKSNQGIDAKGRELGMFARGGESYNDFAHRIQKAIDQRKGQQP